MTYFREFHAYKGYPTQNLLKCISTLIASTLRYANIEIPLCLGLLSMVIEMVMLGL